MTKRGKEVKLHSKPGSEGRVYTTIWRNGEIETLDKELNKPYILYVILLLDEGVVACVSPK